MFGESMFAGASLTMRHREDSDPRGLGGSSLTLTSFMLNTLTCDGPSLLEQVLCLNSLRQVERRAKVFPESFAS